MHPIVLRLRLCRLVLDDPTQLPLLRGGSLAGCSHCGALLLISDLSLVFVSAGLRGVVSTGLGQLRGARNSADGVGYSRTTPPQNRAQRLQLGPGFTALVWVGGCESLPSAQAGSSGSCRISAAWASFLGAGRLLPFPSHTNLWGWPPYPVTRSHLPLSDFPASIMPERNPFRGVRVLIFIGRKGEGLKLEMETHQRRMLARDSTRLK